MYRLSCESIEDVHQFGEPTSLLGFPLTDAVGHTSLDVEPEHRQADPVERGLGSGELLEELDTQTRLLHHPADASNLTLDTVQPRHDRLLVRLVEHHRNCILRLGFGSERYLQNSAGLRRFFDPAPQIRHTTS